MTLRVPPGAAQPTLTIPRRASVEAAERFLVAHERWLAAKLSQRAPGIAFEPGARVPVRGVPHRIRHLPAGTRGTAWIDVEDGEPVLCVTGRPEHLERRVTDALRKMARADLAAAVGRAAGEIGVRPRALRIADTRSQWGSCTAAGVLSSSWRLILAPPLVLDYVAAHEVAHLLERNHGPGFWRLTRRLCPRMEEAKRWLRAHGAALHAIGVAPPPPPAAATAAGAGTAAERASRG
jgi:predicted metal-dependent hydrolase